MIAADRAELIAALDAGARPSYLLFWGHRPKADGSVGPSCMSQWFAAPFTIDEQRYPTAEHYMMSEKARLFDDHAILAELRSAKTPDDAKKLGRKVSNYDDARWGAARFAVVQRANQAKFSQNPRLRAFLLGTEAKVLVEASPYDRILELGLSAKDPKALDPRQWNGDNLLGFALMLVREQLRNPD